MSRWYFAYGSNLWATQMFQRVGPIDDPEHPPRMARLDNYQLVFQHLDETGPAFANILSPGPGVIGVVYRCSRVQLETLDVYESGYQRISVKVIDPAGRVLEAEAYVIQPASGVGHGTPSDEYLKRIILGATEHRLPKSYIESIIHAAQREINRT